MKKIENKDRKFEYDVAISCAGEDRAIAGQIANILRKEGLSVFYDQFYKSELWGKRLSAWFKEKYGKSSRFVLVLISRHYPVKDWTDFEFSIAKAEENKRKVEFILPVRLDGTKFVGLPADKAYLDLKKEGLDGIVDCLVKKVKVATSQKIPEQVFREAYQEWKIEGFLPGDAKVRYFLDSIKKIPLDIDTCEFLFRSITSYYQDLKEKLGTIDKQVSFDASRRMLDKKENNYTKWRGMRYLVFANPKQAEQYLWEVYMDSSEDLWLRTGAFERLWKCESQRGIDESYAIALKEPKWQLRQAAMKNIGYGKARKETSKVVAEALRDKRWEVRAEAAYAIVRLKLGDLVPDMITALKNERSRKGANRLLYCIWNFKNHPSVKELRRKYEFPKWFDKTPDYHVIYGGIMDEIL
jgi:hypothetical protein